MPLLSFIIPCYNKKPELESLLYSIYYSGLDREDYEVIVTDDSDDDDVVDDIVDLVDYYKGWMNIEYYTNTFIRVGPSANRQNGLLRATGKWITFVDHDDIILNSSFSSRLKDILKNKEDMHYSYITTSVYVIDDIKDTEYIEVSKTYKKTLTHGKIYNKQFLDDNGISYDVSAPAHEDIYFNYWVYSATIAGGYDYIDLTADNDCIFYQFRVYNESLSKSRNFFDDFITENPTWFLRKFYKPLEYIEKNQDSRSGIFDIIKNELCYMVIMYIMSRKWGRLSDDNKALYTDLFDKCRLVLHNKVDRNTVAKISTEVLSDNELLLNSIDDIIDYYSLIRYLC